MAGIQKSSRKEVRRPVWAEISLGALAENFHAIRKFVNPPEEKRKTPRKILSIVKGNGYGHGGAQVAKALEKAGSDWFGVTCTEEGIAVRQAGVQKPVLVLTSFSPGEFDGGDSPLRAIVATGAGSGAAREEESLVSPEN